ncbi:MAG: hypothetical protein ACRBN8_22485 [Nannocystales bacterium]
MLKRVKFVELSDGDRFVCGDMEAIVVPLHEVDGKPCNAIVVCGELYGAAWHFEPNDEIEVGLGDNLPAIDEVRPEDTRMVLVSEGARVAFIPESVYEKAGFVMGAMRERKRSRAFDAQQLRDGEWVTVIRGIRGYTLGFLDGLYASGRMGREVLRIVDRASGEFMCELKPVTLHAGGTMAALGLVSAWHLPCCAGPKP